MIKKIALTLASIFLMVQSYNLLRQIHNLDTNSDLLILFIAWIINLFITGIFAFAGFAYPTQALMPNSYYHIYNPERLEKVYQSLKVEWFRKFLLATLWKSKSQRKKYFNGKKKGIENLILQSKKSEFGHLIPFIIINIVVVYLVLIAMYELAFFAFIINIIGNLYPIILQRHHRMRISRLRRR